MFPASTQKKYWTFADENELQKLRDEANKKFIEVHGKELEESKRADLLAASEERIVLHKHELQLREFCRKFVPQMPRAVTGTAFHYFKRFYLKNSVMDYHPKEILVTCVYLACKVEEFNLSMKQFVSNIKGDRDKAAEIILNTELLVLKQLNYQLLVHNPFRPVEGFIIDIKTRGNLQNVDRLRPGIEEFLDKLFLTDAILLYSPSQLALASVIQAASKLQENLDSYVTDVLLGPQNQDELANLIEAIRKIRSIVKGADIKFLEPPQREVIKQLEKRIENCRNQYNNPDSELYKQRMKRVLEDEDDYMLQSRQRPKEKRSGEDPLSGLSSFSSSST